MTTNTATAIITSAYRDAQKLGRGQTISTDQLADGLDRLNDMILLWGTQGLKLWLETETTVSLIAGQQMYSFYSTGDVAIARPLKIKEAAYWDTYGNNRPLLPISREEWTRLSNRDIEGSINQYFVEKLFDRLNMYLWNIPDSTAATGSVKAVLLNKPTTPFVVTDATNFPPEWMVALRWGLADDLTTGMPESVVNRCAARAETFKSMLEDQDVEDAPTYFTPDSRGMGGSAFR